jgi:hypothetical protein
VRRGAAVIGHAHAGVHLLADDRRIGSGASFGTTNWRLGELATAGVTHIGHRAFQLVVGQVGRAALGRHRVEAFQCVLDQGIPALCHARCPGTGVTEFRCASQAAP